MRINSEQMTMDMEERDTNYVLSAYIRSYLFYTKNEDPVKIVFPMFRSVPHPTKVGVQIPIEWVPHSGEIATEISQDGMNVPEAPVVEETKLDMKDKEIEVLKARIVELEGPKSGLGVATEPTKSTVSRAKAAFKVDTNQPPPNRKPKLPPGGDIGPGLSASDLHSRDARDQVRTMKDLAEGPEVDESEEKPFGKTISRDKEGKPVVGD